MQILLETQQAAQAVAFMLRCEYDGCNMVTLPSTYDGTALQTAIALTGSAFCVVGDRAPLSQEPLTTPLDLSNLFRDSVPF